MRSRLEQHSNKLKNVKNFQSIFHQKVKEARIPLSSSQLAWEAGEQLRLAGGGAS